MIWVVIVYGMFAHYLVFSVSSDKPMQSQELTLENIQAAAQELSNETIPTEEDESMVYRKTQYDSCISLADEGAPSSLLLLNR